MNTKNIFSSLLLAFFAVFTANGQTSTKNYVKTETVLVLGNDLESEVDALGYTAKQTVINYYDGLGRPDQTNMYKGSGDGTKDIITSVTYDDFGREEKQYLPFASARNGAYHTSPTSTTNFSIYGTTDDDYAYSQTIYESSPLNRVEKQTSPGYNWRNGSNHELKYEEGTNTTGEVMYFYVNTSGVLTKGTNYTAGTLYKYTSWDENNTQSSSTSRTVEFKDKLGRVILKVNYVSTTAYSTYYVYDEFNLLRFVLPPKAVEDGTVNTTELSELCYQYKYDERKRLIEKKLPGAGWEYMVYDKRDRVVLTQTSTQRTSGYWVFTKYDTYNRPILTGKYESGSTRDTLQTAVNSQSIMYESAGSTVLGYTNNTYPSISDESKYISATYYDSYATPSTWGYSYSQVYTDHAQTNNVKGLVTGVKTKVLGASTWLCTVNYYDKYGRLLQQFQSNPDGGFNRTSTAYNFNSQPIKQQVYHKKTSGATAITTEELYSYDHMGRPSETTHSYNGATAVTIASNTYDDIGRLQTKELNNGYQDIDYSYNIRGWLTKINDPDESYTNSKLFGEELYYNSTGELVNLADYAQHNGNISGIRWRNNDTKRSAYAFTYDGLNRVTKGDYGYSNSNGNVTDYAYYDLDSVGYDKNGNITSLYRKNSTGGTKENLTYTYSSGNVGNQLASLSGTYDGTSVSGKTFVYDGNGNATTDNLRNMTTQYFDEIDLPKQYTVGSQTASYEYDASGTKWSKTAVTSGTTTMEYYGSFIYQDGTLDRVLTPEGYYQNSKYFYYLKDHLGDTRMVVSYNDTTPTVEQVSEYYPFGGMFTENNLEKNKYLYNGKELQNEFFENYDYGARFYDPELARWHSVDPLASDYPSWTPYHYVHNNPILLVDPTGMSADWYEDENKKLVYDETIKSQSDLDTKGIKGEYKGEKGYGINEETGALQTYQPDGTITESSLASNDITVKANPITVAIYQGQKEFIQDPRTQAAITGLTFVATGGIEGVMSLGSLAREGGNFLLNGGKTFSQFKSSYWSGNVKQTLEPIINPETGQVWKQYTELHHRFVPQRWKWAPNWLKNNRLNLTPASSLRHAQMDPYRARFAPEWVKEMYNLKWK